MAREATTMGILKVKFKRFHLHNNNNNDNDNIIIIIITSLLTVWTENTNYIKIYIFKKNIFDTRLLIT